MARLSLLLACAAALAAAACGSGGGSSPAPTPPVSPPPPPQAPAAETIQKTVLAGPLDEPVDLDVLPDGSVFVVERRGRVLLWRNGQGVTEAATFTDLYELPGGGGSEFGLLSIAADPAYASNGFVYVMYDTKPGAVIEQRVSRFHVVGEHFDMSSEKVLLVIPQDETCCHTGGAIRFGPAGLLHIATGDNTDPFEDSGYAPMDPRPGHALADALRSAGNTMDLRGKILRIRPTADGGYAIPDGNLFTDPTHGRAEIYIMGMRNPYSMTFDDANGALYFGDVGPDANDDSPVRGPRGYDEINRVTQASNTGWPLFIGDNFAYKAYDYDAQTGGAAFDPAHPINDSPNNTGARELPPAHPALLYYPYADTPLFGSGGRIALVAGVYHRPQNAPSRALPAYYESKLFIADFMRNWLKAVTLNGDGTVASIEPFAPLAMVSAPLKFEFGPDGALYMIEYGQGWYTANPDSALSRIEYHAP